VIAAVLVTAGLELGKGGEYVVLLNQGAQLNLTGWVLSDDSGTTYRFRNYVLAAGSAVRIHTGSGQDSQTDVFRGLTRSVFGIRKNGTVFLQDPTGAQIDAFDYTKP
jgi:micrococcal nuclease